MSLPSHDYVSIMAGGVGSRFWPVSTEAHPKQFIDILGTGKSLLRMTFERFLKVVPQENIFVVTHAHYKTKILEQLPEITDIQVITEPTRNNTGPAVAYTAFKIFEKDPQANIIMTPADHVIEKEDLFVEKINTALSFSRQNEVLVTLGIQPNRPDTGYGYIHFDRKTDFGTEKGLPHQICKVQDFREKPDLNTAIRYLESGNYLWNAGIFIWKASTILEAFRKFDNNTYECLNKGKGLFNTEKESEFIKEYFPKTSNMSVDYAIMEKADNIYTIPADIAWSDLGTWNALHAFLPKEEDNNVVYSNHKMLIECKNNLIKTPKNKLVVVKGLEDFIIIDEDDVLMIYPKSLEQEIKQVQQEANKLLSSK